MDPTAQPIARPVIKGHGDEGPHLGWSKFSIEDGSRQAGPTEAALDSKKVTVEGDQISIG